MRRIILSIITAVAFATGFAAGTYTPLVREGVEWAYISNHQSPDFPTDPVFYKLQFKGTTEINGKTYHNLYKYNAFSSYLMNERGYAEKFLVAWLREEDRKVYVIYKEAGDPGHNQEYPIQSCFGGDRQERLLYDFNLKKGESFDLLHSNEKPANPDAVLFEKRMTCEETGYIPTPGGQRRYWKFSGDIPEYMVVEGVGAAPAGYVTGYGMISPYYSFATSTFLPNRLDYLLYEYELDFVNESHPTVDKLTFRSCVFDGWGKYEISLWYMNHPTPGMNGIDEVKAPADAFSFDMGADGVKVTGAAAELARVKVYDLAGREHMSVSPLDGRVSIPYTLLPAGIAIVRAEAPDGASRSLKVAVPARD